MTIVVLDPPPATQTPPPQTLEAWYTRCPVPTGFGIALQDGLLRDEFADDTQVAFRALQESTDPAVLQSHYTHTQRNSFRHGGNYPAIYAQATGANTRVIGLSFIRSSQTILTLPGSGIESVKDLRGRRLLVTRRPHEAIDHAYWSALRIYETALRSEGLTLNDVEIVERHVSSSYINDRLVQKTRHDAPEPKIQKKSTGSWSDTLFPLVRGEVDVITAGGSGSIQFETQAGLQVVFDLATLPLEQQANNNSPLVFAVKADLLEQHPELVARVLRRALQAEVSARRNPDAAIRSVALELAQAERLVRHTAGDHFVNNLELDFAPWKIAALKSQAQFLWEKKAIPAPVDVDTWLAPQLLEQVRKSVN